MDKGVLTQISAMHTELQDLRKRLQKLEDKPQNIVVDSVRGSSSNFPYTEHTCKIEGLEKPKFQKAKKKYRKLIRNKESKIDRLIKQVEYDLNYVEDSELRQIIRYVYYDNKNYNQAAHAMNERFNKDKYTADSIRMKINRFFEKK